jgi:hypothetical protein
MQGGGGVRAHAGFEAAQLNRAHDLSCTARTPRKAGGGGLDSWP